MITRAHIRLVLIVAAFLGGMEMQAQQLPQYSQYMHNLFLVNPAAAGMDEYLNVTGGYRQQWSGFDGAPESYYLSGHSYLGQGEQPSLPFYSVPISRPELYSETEDGRKIRHGVGAILAQDDYGAFKRTSISAAYAVHVPVGKRNFISLGANLGWFGLDFNQDLILLEDPDDNTYNDFIANGSNSDLLDLNLGAMFYGERFHIGYGVYQLLQNQVELGNESSPADLADSRLQAHHFITGAYRIPVGESFEIEPSTLVKLMTPSPLTFDFNVKGIYRDAVWLGFSYRYENAMVALAGAEINDTFRIGYSYDLTTSELADYENGTHEIVLGVNLFHKRATR